MSRGLRHCSIVKVEDKSPLFMALLLVIGVGYYFVMKGWRWGGDGVEGLNWWARK